MKNINFKQVAATALLFSGLGATQSYASEVEHFSIGTAGQTGVYYVVGQSICKMVNRETKEHNLRCSAPSTGGSIANLNSIRSGGLNFGTVQSDWQFHALNGTSNFEAAGPYKELRSVFSLHSDIFTLVTRADANIKTFDDLKGKRVNVGNPGSGQRATMLTLMKEKGMTLSDFKLAGELKSAEQSQALCDNKVDAFVMVAGHPVANVKEATSTCSTHIIDVTGPAVDKLIAQYPYYSEAKIPGGMYEGTPNDVTTYGLKATLVVSTDTSDKVVYNMVKAVFENFERFKRLHPAFAQLNPEEMITAGLSAPLHNGAVTYYKERGWIK
ncbi:TAXI family TRAP transporter solute-binding subunit [Marinomonas colpomeniae]|uniref:TAXI family TRAP transporter solute-binding subunit n=1 Tax=Marinomonas colpomeniae TaxID=2774408 RepID=A0ABR8P0I2_9GAMM|nr:TAXI family TRAP transporter solute-binding subunit [Marinomonas colpomeniae]MBD5771801.1 TAXI family TRAP transporter solute-binding subunit [Marinomonas colpomeniae]